jgi:hypothetical protein
MSQSFLLAIDITTEEIIVSESPKGTNKINFIERIKRTDHEILYQAVMTLTLITRAPNLDTTLFKAMDKVCQMIYAKHKAIL